MYSGSDGAADRSFPRSFETSARVLCGSKRRIDRGSEFCNSELRAVVKANDLLDIRTRARRPELNEIVERFNGTVRQESAQQEA